MAMGAIRVRLFMTSILMLSSLVGTSLGMAQGGDMLLAFKSSLDSSAVLDSWVPGTSPCSGWLGIYCFDGVVTGIHLSNMALSGRINIDALRNLNGLQSLDLSGNFFSGSLPEFNRLSGLRSLVLSQNQFSGEIPGDYFASMGSLNEVRLSDNNLSGELPESLVLLTGLQELHLDGNQFTGKIPPMDAHKLDSLELSYNRLVGKIPPVLSSFPVSSFRGNLGLCGKPLGPCADETNPETPAQSPLPKKPDWMTDEMLEAFIWTVIILIVIVILLSIIAITTKKKREEEFRGLGKEMLRVGPEGPVSIPKSKSSRIGSITKRLSLSKKDSFGNLVIVNDEKGTFGLADLMKAAAEVLGNGTTGSSYKAVMSNGLSVIVKRLRDMTAVSKDDFDVAMTRFGTLRHPNILTPLAYHYRREEKLLVSQFMPKGSLSYVLHVAIIQPSRLVHDRPGDREARHDDLNWPMRLKIIRGIARGLGFLHSEFATYDLPHGNLKSVNILLTDTYEAVLNDYAFHPLVDTPQSPQVLQAYKAPESSYRLSPKCDVYCLGVVILEVLMGKFPSQYGRGGTDVVEWARSSILQQREVDIIDPALAKDLPSSKNRMLHLLHIGAACSESDPDRRPSITEAIREIEEV
ncbi:hypothetical protein MLD38_015392 [Melastoma candidum]|uniref:Uncharacterized protein n=1 Tax=Melastoma candidum TaxID=119954 RepID=A0ACB9RFU4_9MYRT|nr:hypothetical protein MLD38_015392 [Melastoma candidum]